jgi:hypothetical protein
LAIEASQRHLATLRFRQLSSELATSQHATSWPSYASIASQYAISWHSFHYARRSLRMLHAAADASERQLAELSQLPHEPQIAGHAEPVRLPQFLIIFIFITDISFLRQIRRFH